MHSIAARRREHAVAAEWTETHSAWERQMASLRDSLNDERQASCAGDGQRSGGDAAAADRPRPRVRPARGIVRARAPRETRAWRRPRGRRRR